MSGSLVMIKTALIKQVRSYRFLITVAASIAFAWFCVPTSKENYNIIVVGGSMRGLYNSAYLGAIASIASSIVFFIAGFFLLRSQISEDRDLRIGQIIAAKSISKLRYVLSKAASNFIVLISWQAVFLLSVVAVQLVRGEDSHVVLSGYLTPFLEITLPMLVVLASLTVLFDAVAVLRGMVGNVILFTAWLMLIILPEYYPNQPFLDLLGFKKIGDAISSAVMSGNPGIAPEAVDSISFGLNLLSESRSTFMFNGLEPDSAFVATRFIWAAAALALTVLAALIFDRFKKNKPAVAIRVKNIKKDTEPFAGSYAGTMKLSSVSEVKGGSLPALIKGELSIMFSEFSWLQLLLILTGAGLNLLLPREYLSGMFHLFLILPTSVWAGMGCRDRVYRTSSFIISRCDLRDKWTAEFISGMTIALFALSGTILRNLFAGEWLAVASCVVGAFFITSLAHASGILTGSRRLFEALFIIWLYCGPVQDIPFLNFLSNAPGTVSVYGLFGVILTGIGYITVSMKEKGLLLINGRN